MEVIEAMKTRRSIRRYKTTPVDDKTVELVLEAARWHHAVVIPNAGGLL